MRRWRIAKNKERIGTTDGSTQKFVELEICSENCMRGEVQIG